MDISNNISLTIDEFENSQYSYTKFIFFEGIGGVIPELRITIDGFSDESTKDELSIKLIVDGEVKIDNKGFVYKRSVSDNKLIELSMYLVPKDFVYDIKSASYESTDEIISSLWTGSKSNIPSGGSLVCNQCLVPNSNFLTRALLTLQDNFNFCYEMSSNNLLGIDMSDHTPDVEIKSTDEYSIESRLIKAEFNPLESIEPNSEEITAIGVSTINTDRYSDLDGLNYYLNYAKNRAIQLRYNQELNIHYFNYGNIKIGDIIKISLSSSLDDIYRAMFTRIEWINRTYKVITTIMKVNEG